MSISRAFVAKFALFLAVLFLGRAYADEHHSVSVLAKTIDVFEQVTAAKIVGRSASPTIPTDVELKIIGEWALIASAQVSVSRAGAKRIVDQLSGDDYQSSHGVASGFEPEFSLIFQDKDVVLLISCSSLSVEVVRHATSDIERYQMSERTAARLKEIYLDIFVSKNKLYEKK